MTCKVCKDDGWVCENHPDQPWNKEGCECGAGMPCETCNTGNPPRMQPGFTPICSVYSDGESIH